MLSSSYTKEPGRHMGEDPTTTGPSADPPHDGSGAETELPRRDQRLENLTGQRLGRYRIVEQIGSGGAGVVYRASDERLKREVAVKVLHRRHASNPERLALFTQEAQTVAALSHPNILTLHDVGTERGLWYAVTEFL